MPKVNKVTKCRKAQRPCGKCGCEIKVGDGYLYWEFAYNPTKFVRCLKPECAPKPADLTQSEFVRALAAIQETTFEGDTIDDLENAKDGVVSELEALRDEQEEKKSNMPESLQESSTGQLLQERYDALDEAINALEGVDITWQEPDKAKDETDEAFATRKEEEQESRIEEIRDELQSAVGDISCG